MKRKLISLFLTLTTVFACLSMAIVPGAAEGTATPTPEVWFGGHQRTVVADTTYGIRLVGLTNGLNADEVGFDVAVIKNDGSMATFSEPITMVYTSITANVEGKATTITAASEGAAYIFTLVLDDIDPKQGFWGYLCSTYYVVDGQKVSGETNRIIYKGAEQWKESYILNDKPVETNYLTFDDGTGEKDLQYIMGDGDGANGNEETLKKIWNGVKGSSDYSFYYNWDNAGSWCSAYFDEPTVIGKLVLSTAWKPWACKNVAIQASVTGNEGDWVTLYTIDLDDFDYTDKKWAEQTLEVPISDTTAYNYIRVYDTYGQGFCFTEVEVFAMEKIVPSELADANYQTFDDGNGNKTLKYIYGDGNGANANEETLKKIWNGVTGINEYAFYYNWDNAGSWCSASFDEPTVIQKLVLSTGWKSWSCVGVAIQASVNGNDWETLYTIANGDFSGTDKKWAEETLEIAISDTTAYNYIRVYDTTGNGFCFTEIQVYTPQEGYIKQFADKLATTLPIA